MIRMGEERIEKNLKKNTEVRLLMPFWIKLNCPSIDHTIEPKNNKNNQQKKH